MKELLKRFAGWRLQRLLVLGFALTTAISIAVGTPVTDRVIRSYLKDAQDRRVGRDMDLAEAFYNLKMGDISSMARRIASDRSVRHTIKEATEGNGLAVDIIEEVISTELSSLLPATTRRLAVVVDPGGISVAGLVSSSGEFQSASPHGDWSDLSILQKALLDRQPEAATEVVPAAILNLVGLAQQAHITLEETPKAAPEPFDPREGTAGLALISVAPILSEGGSLLGAVVVGHLINKDFTLVDRIKEVAGVDTVTIFFGDLRVSTNVLNEFGNRALGTRVSQEVFEHVLLGGEEFTGPAYVVNQDYITRYRPLYDHVGQIVGMLYVGAKQATFQLLVDSFRRQVFLIAAASLLLAVLIAIPIAWSISRPLSGLASATQSVAHGDWSVRVPVKGYQEMQTLAGSFNTMVGTLEQTREQLVQKEKLASVGQLAAGVAHEINNPLGSVLLYADILHKETPQEDLQQRDDLQMIIREATRCKTIVNDLLNFSRQNEVLAQDTDVNSMLRDIATESAKQELFDQVQIEVDLDPSVGIIQADPLQLHQVFVNLMSNAAEAMPEGGRLILRTRKGPVAGSITIEVEDTGVGIPEENMKKMFTPFFTTKPIGKGTGLGLAIVYGIVKMHRGQINLKSKVGKGTTFTITLQEKLPDQYQQPEGTFVLQ